MREAPSIVIANELLRRGAKVIAYDPVAIEEAKILLGNRIAYSDNAYSALTRCRCTFINNRMERIPISRLVKS
jgi:UDPglucose 6-dehydrogenase